MRDGLEKDSVTGKVTGRKDQVRPKSRVTDFITSKLGLTIEESFQGAQCITRGQTEIFLPGRGYIYRIADAMTTFT